MHVLLMAVVPLGHVLQAPSCNIVFKEHDDWDLLKDKINKFMNKMAFNIFMDFAIYLLT
jgi:hypothetical protein